MCDGNVAHDQCVGNHRAMATPRHCFGAHQGRRFRFGEFQGALESRLKFRSLHIVSETAKARVVPAEILRVWFRVPQAAQFFQVDVSNFGGAQRGTEGLAIELRIVAGAWDGTDIYYSLDAVRLQRGDELLQGTRGMADGEDRGLRVLATGGHGFICSLPDSCNYRASSPVENHQRFGRQNRFGSRAYPVIIEPPVRRDVASPP